MFLGVMLKKIQITGVQYIFHSIGLIYIIVHYRLFHFMDILHTLVLPR